MALHDAQVSLCHRLQLAVQLAFKFMMSKSYREIASNSYRCIYQLHHVVHISKSLCIYGIKQIDDDVKTVYKPVFTVKAQVNADRNVNNSQCAALQAIILLCLATNAQSAKDHVHKTTSTHVGYLHTLLHTFVRVKLDW
jgi:hypothetical protein